MSAVEAGLSGPERARDDLREAVQQYIGEGVVVVSDVRVEPFVRQQRVLVESKPAVLTRVVAEDYYISCNVQTDDGIRRHDQHIANQEDEFTLRRFNAETGVHWSDAKVWVTDAQN